MKDQPGNGKTPTDSPEVAPVSGSAADSIITPDDAYNQGWGAKMLGKTKASNPYLEDTDLWLWFNTGWEESEP